MPAEQGGDILAVLFQCQRERRSPVTILGINVSASRQQEFHNFFAVIVHRHVEGSPAAHIARFEIGPILEQMFHCLAFPAGNRYVEGRGPRPLARQSNQVDVSQCGQWPQHRRRPRRREVPSIRAAGQDR